MTRFMEDDGRKAAPSADQQELTDSAILNAVRSIRYGSVEVTIHDSRVVQIECKKRIRFQQS